jgi:hypothetical protein
MTSGRRQAPVKLAGSLMPTFAIPAAGSVALTSATNGQKRDSLPLERSFLAGFVAAPIARPVTNV